MMYYWGSKFEAIKALKELHYWPRFLLSTYIADNTYPHLMSCALLVRGSYFHHLMYNKPHAFPFIVCSFSLHIHSLSP